MRVKPRYLFIVPFLIALLFVPFAVLRIDQPIQGVTQIEFLDVCQAEVYDTTRQPVLTFVLACRGVDAIRIWPLPIHQPWYEDWWEEQKSDTWQV